ncbi:ferritin-like domain-containing protein [Diaphorobacter aerolatus]|uniref:Ferritin-like domain-containing protein n=1 Tax=Diaphorobacter aerolatus TaxID=1288495 RepID=A0A7H0GPZ5_9BURK|nr:ferritin-like domain-containing protein [Diaphorobacter aerolatus]
MSTQIPLGTDQNEQPERGHWQIDDLDFDAIERSAIEDNEDLFYLLMSASFIETGSETYAANLAEHYSEYPEITAWLRDRWESEELQHGTALRRYVEAVWPEFPWQKAYDSFFDEYSKLCTVEELHPDRHLEMVARCVVETGTTAYYHTLREQSDEPVLRELLGNIRNDEVGHFKHFLKYFKQLQENAPVARTRIAGALYARLKELRESDSDVALRHVYAHRGNYFAQSQHSFADIAQRAYELISSQLPADLAVRMLLKPLLLPARLEGYLHAPIARLATRVMAP